MHAILASCQRCNSCRSSYSCYTFDICYTRVHRLATRPTCLSSQVGEVCLEGMGQAQLFSGYEPDGCYTSEEAARAQVGGTFPTGDRGYLNEVTTRAARDGARRVSLCFGVHWCASLIGVTGVAGPTVLNVHKAGALTVLTTLTYRRAGCTSSAVRRSASTVGARSSPLWRWGAYAWHTGHSPLTTHHSPLTTHYAPLTTHHAPLTTHHSLRTMHHSLRTTHYSPLTTHHSLRTTHHSLLTTH